MSHFAVAVNAPNEDDLFDMMLPYYEYGCSEVLDNLVAPYLVFEPGDDIEELRADYEAEQPPEDPTFHDFLADYGYVQNQDGVYGVWKNPNAKWDGYKIGGRYSNCLILTSGEKCNDALVSQIDFYAIRSRQSHLAGENWRTVNQILSEVGVSMPDFLKMSQADFKPYYDQVGRIAKDDIGTFFCFDVETAKSTFGKHIAYWHERPFTYALLDKQGWLARATMGWFGCSYDPNDTFEADFWQRISQWQPTDRVYVVDCHI